MEQDEGGNIAKWEAKANSNAIDQRRESKHEEEEALQECPHCAPPSHACPQQLFVVVKAPSGGKSTQQQQLNTKESHITIS